MDNSIFNQFCVNSHYGVSNDHFFATNYGTHSKISNTSLSVKNKMLVFGAGINKILVRIANREDPDQTLIWVCNVCLA